MADVVSDEARQQIATIHSPFVVRLDLPYALDQPETEVFVEGAQTPGHCSVMVALLLAEHTPIPDANIQIRVWACDGDSRQLVFDKTVQAHSVNPLMSEFALQEVLARVPPLDEAAEEARRAMGGPFDTDHALVVASLNANRTT